MKAIQTENKVFTEFELYYDNLHTRPERNVGHF